MLRRLLPKSIFSKLFKPILPTHKPTLSEDTWWIKDPLKDPIPELEPTKPIDTKPPEVVIPPVEEPVVEPIEEPITEPVETPVETPVVETPVTEQVDTLDNHLWIVLAAHADGLAQLQDVKGWQTLALDKAKQLQDRGICWTLELTEEEIQKLLDNGGESWFWSMGELGVFFAPRESHKGFSSTPEDAEDLLLEITNDEVMFRQDFVLSYVGSYLDDSVYKNGAFDVLSGGASLGHTSDAEWSGFKYSQYKDFTGTQIILIGAGTANSVAKKVGIAREIARGQRTWAVELLRFNAVGLNGSTQHFVTPSTHGTNPPKDIVSEVDTMLASIEKEGNTLNQLGKQTIQWTDCERIALVARINNQVIDYIIPKS